jgi:hypothetical protein
VQTVDFKCCHVFCVSPKEKESPTAQTNLKTWFRKWLMIKNFACDGTTTSQISSQLFMI